MYSDKHYSEVWAVRLIKGKIMNFLEDSGSGREYHVGNKFMAVDKFAG